MKNKFKFIIMFTVLALFGFAEAGAETDISSDSRIKTLVFNENEIYSLVARNGFQSAVELAPDEKIETISIGDPIGWQITPSGRRVFIKPLHKTGTTNLSIITNKRSYQFELKATADSSSRSGHAYLIRFFYPTQSISFDGVDRTRGNLRPVSDTPIPNFPAFSAAPQMPAPNLPSPPQAFNPPMPAPAAPPQPTVETFNFNYTLTGPDSLAPRKIFDDGKSTFFEFPNPVGTPPQISVVSFDGSETPLPARVEGSMSGGLVVVDRVAGKFTIRQNRELICVYNESIASLPSPSSGGGYSNSSFSNDRGF
ncbi:MAG: hypothetical protein COV36_00485 [Alphaproteobacteria bacterium CG11_big_fil_rev_8_21_14_0_20_44_7]|nr:MAG: hypothetical protein COV36_00485 [Alphaproteobacteria bacterium CG11_big_fil_rev_8_21_14_0_20_44_7]